MAFAKKTLDVNFNYVSAATGELTLSGLRVACVVSNVGVTGVAQMNLAIFGMSLSHMNALTVLPTEAGAIAQNTVTVLASDGGVPQTVFTGTIQSAVADARGMPEVVFRVTAQTAGIFAIKPADPTSVPGSTDVPQLAQMLAGQMGLALENSGVQAKLSNPYLHGTLLKQFKGLAASAGMSWTVDPDVPVLAMWPRGSSRAAVVSMSPATGMVGYPSFTSSGIAVQSLYNQQIKIGVSLLVQSDFTPACGLWQPYKVTHELESQIPRGKWFSYAECSRKSAAAVRDEGGG